MKFSSFLISNMRFCPFDAKHTSGCFFQTFKFLRLFTKHMNAADFVCTLILHTKFGSFTFSDHSFLDLRCSVHVVRFYHLEENVRDDLLDQQAFIFS